MELNFISLQKCFCNSCIQRILNEFGVVLCVSHPIQVSVERCSTSDPAPCCTHVGDSGEVAWASPDCCSCSGRWLRGQKMPVTAQTHSYTTSSTLLEKGRYWQKTLNNQMQCDQSETCAGRGRRALKDSVSRQAVPSTCRPADGCVASMREGAPLTHTQFWHWAPHQGLAATPDDTRPWRPKPPRTPA